MTKAPSSYIKRLKERGTESHVYTKYQLLGLEISQILKDEKHKALYIKLAKERGGERMLRIAKEVMERKGIKNRGAYFMAVLKSSSPAAPHGK